MHRWFEFVIITIVVMLLGLIFWPVLPLVTATKEDELVYKAEANTEELKAYFAWCKLKNRWDIRLDEWRALRRNNLLP